MIKVLEIEKKYSLINMASEIVYAQKPDWCHASIRALKLSLMRPRNYFEYDPNDKRPLILWICGGGFSGVDCNVWIPELAYLTRNGFAVASVEYSVKDETIFPEPEEEIKWAIRYLRSHQNELFINAERIVVMGESAGGYLSLFTGLTNGMSEFEKGEYLGTNSTVQGIIAWYPVVHKLDCEQKKLNSLPDLKQYITENVPPVLMLHGTEDTVVPYSHSEEMYKALEENGTDVELYLIRGANHGDQHFVQEEVRMIILDFLRRIIL